MSELLHAQRAFAGALRDPAEPAYALHWQAGDPALLERRMAVYRANVTAAAGKALAAAFPMIGQIVGAEYFDGLVREHLRAHPSTSGDLTDHGHDFAQFLQHFAPAQSLPYLPDVASLEWAVHRAYGAADAAAFDPSVLGLIAPEDQSRLRFDWAPGTTVIASTYPLARVWALHRPDYSGDYEVDWSIAECALVAREGHAVTVSALSPGDAAFITASLAGAPLATATDAALAASPEWDLGALLARAVGAHWICGAAANDDHHHHHNNPGPL